jgi:zinc-binding in reverse transcriptase
LSFNRNLTVTLNTQLLELYNKLAQVQLGTEEDSITWRWSNSGVFTTNSYYYWLEFGGIKSPQFQITWSAYISLKIKIFLWLVQKNKILTKENLRKRGWQGDTKCIFYNELETTEHLFVHCSISVCLWNWFTSYNNFQFNCNCIQELWLIDANIPYKDPKLCELVRGTFLWVIWNERNRLIFKGD